MEFDAEAQAAPPKGDNDETTQDRQEDTMDREEGDVDLNEGGKLESKTRPDSEGDDADAPRDESDKTQRGQREDIQVEGEKLRGEKELEAAPTEDGGDNASEQGPQDEAKAKPQEKAASDPVDEEEEISDETLVRFGVLKTKVVKLFDGLRSQIKPSGMFVGLAAFDFLE